MKRSLLLGLIMMGSVVYGTPVIINDTTDWNGFIEATKLGGFSTFTTGNWVQSGANTRSVTATMLTDADFKPTISGVGLNTVKLTYNNIGFGWPTLGLNVEDEINFQTEKLIISKTRRSTGKNILVSVLLPVKVNQLGSTFPHDGKFSVDESVTISNRVLFDISGGSGGASLGLAIFALLPGLAPATVVTTSIASTIAAGISTFANIYGIETSYMKGDFYFTDPSKYPKPLDVYHVYVGNYGDGYAIDTEIYDGGKKGFAPDGEKAIIAVTYLTNLHMLCQLSISPKY